MKSTFNPLTYYHFLFSCFTKLSDYITIQPGENSDMCDFRDHFPSFLWLLRDATLKPVSETDDELSPTDYLKKQVLCRSKKGLPTPTDIVAMAILGYFPTIECQLLPQPSGDKDIIQNIAEREEELSNDFNTRIEEVIQSISENVSAKRGFNNTPVDGSTLVLLAQEYIAAINQPGNILALECSWHTVVTLKLKELMEKLVTEYKSEMEAAFKEKAPLDEYPRDEGESETLENSSEAACCRPVTLMQMHDGILISKRKIFQDEMKHLMPSDIEGNESLPEQREVLMAEFERRIVEYEEVNDGGEVITKAVCGGVLYSFVRRNKQKSLEYCTQLFECLFKPIQELISTPSPDASISMEEFGHKIDVMLDEYRRKGIGPAVEEVYHMRKNDVLKYSTEMLQKIQGFNQQTISALQKADAARIHAEELNEAVKQRTNELTRVKLELELQKNDFMFRVEELKKVSDQRLHNELRKQRELFDAKMKEAMEQSKCKMAHLKEEYTHQISRLQQHQKNIEADYKAKIAALEQGTFTSCDGHTTYGTLQ